MTGDDSELFKSTKGKLSDGQRRDRERLAAYHYARLLGAGHHRMAAARQAAVLIPVSVNHFLLSVWPRFRYRAGIKAAMEMARNPQDLK